MKIDATFWHQNYPGYNDIYDKYGLLNICATKVMADKIAWMPVNDGQWQCNNGISIHNFNLPFLKFTTEEKEMWFPNVINFACQIFGMCYNYVRCFFQFSLLQVNNFKTEADVFFFFLTLLELHARIRTLEIGNLFYLKNWHSETPCSPLPFKAILSRFLYKANFSSTFRNYISKREIEWEIGAEPKSMKMVLSNIILKFEASLSIFSSHTKDST